MALELQQILALLAFGMVLAFVNIKSTQWPIIWASFLGLIAALIGAGVVMAEWIF